MHNLAETEAPSINKIICPSSGLAGKSVESVCELVIICICMFPRTSTMSELLNPTPLLKRFILAFELEAGSLGIPLITPAINHHCLALGPSKLLTSTPRNSNAQPSEASSFLIFT